MQKWRYEHNLNDGNSNFYKDSVTKLKHFLTELYKYPPKVTDKDNCSSDDVTAPEVVPVIINNNNVASLEQVGFPELMTFLKQQETYVRQLELEYHRCRDEISKLVSKMKEMIFEKENLRKKAKSFLSDSSSLKFIADTDDHQNDSYDNRRSNNVNNAISNDDVEDRDKDSIKKINTNANANKIFDTGPVMFYESRISKLEACLDKTKTELRNVQNNLMTLKSREKKIDCQREHQKQIEILQRENNEMGEIIVQSQLTIDTLREKEIQLTKKLRQRQNEMEEMRFEKLQADGEVRRLVTELDKLQAKYRESLQEQCHIKQQCENQYSQQIEKLLSDLQDQWDKHSQLNLQINKQKRTEFELRDELMRKDNHLEDTKKELNDKISRLQNEIISINAKKENLGYQITDLKVRLEQSGHEVKLMNGKHQQEINGLTQRLDRTETELSHSRNENMRLNEQISVLQKQLHLTTLAKDESANQSMKIEQDLTNMVLDMDSKRGKRISDLENMIQSQSQVINRLKEECKALILKLDDEGLKHKEAMTRLQNNLEYLNTKINYSAIQNEDNEWTDEGPNYPINPDNPNL